jgi:hypothetical protein
MTDSGTPPSTASDAPWLTERGQAIAWRLLSSFETAYGRPLLAGLAGDASPRQRAQELFSCGMAVLAHDGDAAEPRIIYANRVALRLWRHTWNSMQGMPSRLTAEPNERQARAAALALARQRQAIEGYAGIRIDSHGRRFRIEAARVWSLGPDDGNPGGGGQGAAFEGWWWL